MMLNGLFEPRLRMKAGKKSLTVAVHLLAPLRVETTMMPVEKPPNSTAYGFAITWMELTASPGSCTGLMPAAGSSTCAPSISQADLVGPAPLDGPFAPVGRDARQPPKLGRDAAGGHRRLGDLAPADALDRRQRLGEVHRGIRGGRHVDRLLDLEELDVHVNRARDTFLQRHRLFALVEPVHARGQLVDAGLGHLEAVVPVLVGDRLPDRLTLAAGERDDHARQPHLAVERADRAGDRRGRRRRCRRDRGNR